MGVATWKRDEPTSVARGMGIPLGEMGDMTGCAWIGISRVSPLASNESLDIGQLMGCTIIRATV